MTKIANGTYQGELKKAKNSLLHGVFFTSSTLINTEQHRITRGSSSADKSCEEAVKRAKKLAKDFAEELKSALAIRIPTNNRDPDNTSGSLQIISQFFMTGKREIWKNSWIWQTVVVTTTEVLLH